MDQLVKAFWSVDDSLLKYNTPTLTTALKAIKKIPELFTAL
ncbi:hypothetical protein LRHMDP2_2132 [Lacticaseibacillus rhamnosus LRHMDP2]|uniref:Site-specific DNA-methyltransferase (adenine-specific) n=1 Tax=Lacticaseibacillus rhamnosus LRHMDP3 TaxID=1203259 RepID=A0AB33XVX3_LACRH|nr:hypothetical protein LRHMDP2_2132 [Lacticaseibacillus rhamnosus LRHMDP2]EKS52213.1 hypothetical protein LRHMDP3_584 [Lacticaseibacillus rhamnosus LRHMDP3]